MTRPLIAQIDMDGVLADFMAAFTRRAKRMGLTDKIVRNADQLVWDAYGDVPADKVSDVWEDIKADPGFWYNVPPLVSQEVFDWIDDIQSRHVDVYFVTARVGLGAKTASTRWLLEQGVFHPTVVRASNKGRAAHAIRATHVIDDNWENTCSVVHLSEARSFILDRPYNQGEHPNITRVKTVGDFLNTIEKELAA